MEVANFISEELLDPNDPYQAGVGRALVPIVALKFIHATDETSKSQMRTDILMTIARALKHDHTSLIPPKCVKIYKDNMEILDKLHEMALTFNSPSATKQVSLDEMIAYKQVKASSYVNFADVVKFIQHLSKKLTEKRPDSASEMVITNNDLNIALAVDGFTGFQPQDYRCYCENLTLEPGENNHVDSIRKMYQYKLLNGLNGTDSAMIVFMALLKVYRDFFVENGDTTLVAIESMLEKLTVLLDKNSEYYASIKEIGSECINELANIYKTNTINIKDIAVKKCKMLTDNENRKKKRDKDDTAGKAEKSARGRPKNSTAKENEKDVEKKRPRSVKPPAMEDEVKKEHETESDQDDQ